MKRGMTFFVFIFLLFSYSHTNAFSENNKENKCDLSEEWLFSIEDRISNKDIEIDDTNWDRMCTQYLWCNKEKYSQHRGIVWYRFHLDVDGINGNQAIIIPLHFGGAHFYFNGNLVYESRRFADGSFDPLPGKPDIIQIPSHLIRKKDNVIAIRISALGNDCNFLRAPIFGDYEYLKNSFYRSIYKIFAFSSIDFFLSLFFFFLFIKRKNERFYLFFAILALSISMWLIGINGYILYLFDNRIVYYIATYIGSCFILISIMLFIHEIFQIRIPLLTRIIIGTIIFEILWLAIELIFTGMIYYFSKHLYMFHISLTLLITLCYTGLCIWSTIKGKQYSLPITIGISCLAIPSVIAVIDFLRIYRFESLIAEGFFLMSISIALVLASRYANVFTSLEKAHSELVVLDKMKDDFLATTSHELRTPLHGIIGLSESMVRGELGELNEAQKENIELIRSSASHLTSLVNEILDFSKLRAGKADLFLEKTRVDDIAAMVVSLMKHSASEKGIELLLNLKPVPEITADRNRLRQIIINLVGNAIKFTDKGKVDVIVEGAEKGGVRLIVRDTGHGIEEKDLVRIWNPFEQAENPDTRRSGGTGLGLPISRYLVELHGGIIYAKSEPGKGTSFIVELPSAPPARGIHKAILKQVLKKQDLLPDFTRASSVPDENVAYQPHFDIGNITILAVDDDPVNLRVIEQICRVAGYDIATAASGVDALKILQEQNIDLVLLDLMLPGMSGLEVCQKMRDNDRFQNVPIIMVTARDTAGDLVRGFSTGANDYITKPFTREELLVRIENQLVIRQMLDMEKSVINGLRKEKDSITNLLQRSQDIKESTLQMLEWERIVREDLNIAHSFQMKLMTHAKNIAGMESSIIYQPILKLGGDIYDIFQIRPGVARVFLADATGHGITASLNTVKILSEYAAIKETLQSPEAVVSFLNRRFCALYEEYRIVFTCVVADIDSTSGTISAATAGHPDFYLLKQGSSVSVKPPGPIVGFSSTYEYTAQIYPMGKGDIVLLYTDGLIDLISDQHGGARNPDFNVWEKLESRIQRINTARPLDEILAQIMQPPIDERLSRGRAEDDITIIAIRRV